MFRVMSPKGYLQRPGLRSEVGEIIRPLTSHIHILTSPHAWQAVNPALTISLEQAGIRWQLDMLTGECTDAAIASLQQRVQTHGATLILAVGGGRVLDCAK
ncbi:MAG TPA: oxidoreductase, partial [Pantoea sp.]|nr:oxidoreductase [Pantoea sp.]